MDFFEAQTLAKKRSGRLVVLFILALLGTMAALYAAALFIGDLAGYETDSGWWRPGLFGAVSLGTLLVCGIASLTRWQALRAGGPAVAEMVGGRRVQPHTTDVRERTLLNVVEEMALASGVPVPAVYILPDEPGINAFAAGYSPGDAAVAVTDGALARLDRDELQGVIAHEFSHILNGDMRLNTRLSALVFGILALSVIGRVLFRSTARARLYGGGRRSGKNSGGGAIVVIMLAGLALLVIGYIGHLFGRLIQAAVSRQREYLADAAAVQFTRNPIGLGGALKKVGGTAVRGQLHNAHASEISHFCFVQNFGSAFSGAFATHPPLDKRIRSIEPSWNGRFLESRLPTAPPPPPAAPVGSSARGGPPPLFGAGTVLPGMPPIAQVLTAAAILGSAGQIAPNAVAAERSFLAKLPDPIRDAAHDGSQVEALCFALCLPRTADAATLAPLQELIAGRTDAATARRVAALRGPLQEVPHDHHLSLLHLAAPVLRQLDPSAAARLVETLDALIRADGQMSVREFALHRIVSRTLGLAANPRDAVHVLAPAQVAPELSIALSAAARIEAPDETTARQAFARAAVEFNGLQPPLAYRPDGAASWEKLDEALEHLAHTPAPFRKRILGAFATALTADSRLSSAEADLLRAFAAALDCPLPPILPVSAA
jgi:Zn-dependent protease with chaperone function